jgi:hypothetical protein
MACGFHIGRGLALIALDERGVELEGTCRLTPGRAIVLFGLGAGVAAGRHLFVSSWRLVRMGRTGPIYHGYAEWRDDLRESATPREPAPPAQPAVRPIREWQGS